MKKYLSIDIGGTNVKYGLYNEKGEELQSGKQMPTILDSLDGFLHSLSEAISPYVDIDGIALSVPGKVDKDTGFLHHGGSIRILDNVDIRKILSERHNVLTVIENDANCAVMAEHWLGNGKGCENLVCITIGTGIGGGIIINNRIYRGSGSHSGEFCYMYTSLDARVENVFNNLSTSNLLKKTNSEASLNIANGKDFFSNLDNPDIKRFYDAWIRDLAVSVYNIGVAFDPEKILLGGGVSGQSGIVHDINAVIKEIAIRDYSWTVDVCKFGNDAGKIGAVYNLLNT